MEFSAVRSNNVGMVTVTTPEIIPTTLRNTEQSIIDFVIYHQEDKEGMGSFVPPLGPSNVDRGSVHPKLHALPVVTKDMKNIKRPLNSIENNMGCQSKCSKRPKTGENVEPEVEQRRRWMREQNRLAVAKSRKRRLDYTTSLEITSQEEERRRQRRERNKLAAAKYRKRRVDHSKSLQEEVEDLVRAKSTLQNLIAKLKEEKEQLELVLSTHNPSGIKDKNNFMNTNVPEKPERPTSLPRMPVNQHSLPSTPDLFDTGDSLTSMPDLFDTGDSLLSMPELLDTGFTPGSSPVITTAPDNILSWMSEL